jgi:hypothetical protein
MEGALASADIEAITVALQKYDKCKIGQVRFPAGPAHRPPACGEGGRLGSRTLGVACSGLIKLFSVGVIRSGLSLGCERTPYEIIIIIIIIIMWHS